MTYAAGPSNNLHQWLNKHMPELQVKPVSNQPVNANQADAKSVGTRDAVTFSGGVERLNQIVKQFFPTDPISQDETKQLSLNLYRQGNITAEEYGQLTGERLPLQGSITQALEFLTSFIEVESVDGDVEGARSLGKALDVLREIEEPMTALKAGRERESTSFVRDYRNLLQEAEVDPELVHEFDQVVGVFNALADLRAQAHQGVVTTYASLNAHLRGSG